MELIKTSLEGLHIIKPEVFEDKRGYFFESFQKEKFREAGIEGDFLQDNESRSIKGVLRGLHFQAPPFEQGKLVRVVLGSVLDVAVDIRVGSPTYGKWESMVLSSSNKLMAWIPEGFAHGFITLADDTIFQYKCTGLYNKEAEGSLRWNDPDLNIRWNITEPMISEKDGKAPFFRDLISPFIYKPV
jgi:dTDP-4-dehydrorhamnose 3,5-epimerase